MSSATSGFFFCGMIDEPVAKASENSTKPNSAVAQSVRSAASRDRCMAVIAAAARNSSSVSRSLTESRLFGETSAKPRSLASASRSIGNAVPAFVDRDLVVAGTPGVQLAADLADQLLQSPLDVRVDVLELGAIREGARRELVPDGREPPHDRVALGGGQEPGSGEGLGPRD